MQHSSSDARLVPDRPIARVAILERDSASLGVMSDILRGAGYQVTAIAANGAVAADGQDVVVLGTARDGSELPVDSIDPGIPILALCDPTMVDADAFLPPPFSADELLRAVRLLLHLHGRRAAAGGEVLVDVGAVLQLALQRAASDLDPGTQVTCEFDSRLRVVADPEQLCLIFVNLLLTAAGRIDACSTASHGIRVAGWRTAEGRTVIEISDTGQRIAASQLAQLFEATDAAPPPTGGLSLPASQRAVRARGGDITVKSKVSGSSFRVELPTADA